MGHFAELDENNIVLRVCVIDNAHIPSDMHIDGETWCENFWEGTWKQTSYNNNFRKQYAGIGYSYNTDLDMFISPQPYDSWSLDDLGDWQSPVTYPTVTTIDEEELGIIWDEPNLQWITSTIIDDVITNYEWDDVNLEWVEV